MFCDPLDPIKILESSTVKIHLVQQKYSKPKKQKSKMK